LVCIKIGSKKASYLSFVLVIVKFKPEITEEAKEKTAQDVLALKDSIPQIISASAGKNFTDRGKGYEWGTVLMNLINVK
jgi:septin family protein